MRETVKVRILAVAVMLFASVLLLVSCGSCEHVYRDGACTECGEAEPGYSPTCPHEYEGGVCVKCSERCLHLYVNGACTECLEVCSHTYTNGVCITCSSVCPHVFLNGVCSVCDFVCAHRYTDGVCSVCGFACAPHYYVDSVCVKCGASCKHEYDDGVCTLCGFADPEHIPSDKGASMYAEIVDKYKYLVLYKLMNEELPPRNDSGEFYTDALYEVVGHFDPTKNFGYSYKDIDGDGYAELLLIENTSRIYAMFTIKDKDIMLVSTFQQGMGYLTEWGDIFFNTKEFDDDGQIFLGNNITRLISGTLVGISYGWDDSDGSFATQGDDVYYVISETGERTELTYEEYKAFKRSYDFYWENATRLTKKANLSFNPALSLSEIADTVADFSTYENIIKTFTYMHTVVTGGKCVRSKWIGGAYDSGMIFESEEDFVIYNKLFMASCLVVSKERAVFGYAMRDLDGDGNEELILLESNFNVLAIFTEIDGRAKLLDSYNDLRTAFIDADGLIHVSERRLPGIEGDFEYFVYEIKNGEPLARVSLGVKYDSESGGSVYYEIADGKTVEMEKSEWDTLYSEYSLDIGDASASEYTEENSGLLFTALPTADSQ